MKFKPSPRLQQWTLSLALIIGSGCDEGTGPSCSSLASDEGKAVSFFLFYEPEHMQLWATLPMVDNTPFTDVPVIDHYGIYPQLPPGLHLDTLTGKISGTPLEALPATEFSIAAFGTAGESPQTYVTIEILAAAAPSDFSYTPDSLVGVEGTAMPHMQAQFAGIAQSFSVDPPFTTHEHIDEADGTISGGFYGPYGPRHYTVTVSNPFGSAQAEITLETTPADIVNGLLVPSSNDRTLDVFALRGLFHVPIDAEYFGGAAVLDVVATKDGRFLYVAASNGKLYGIARDRASGYCESPQELEGTSPAYKLAVSADGTSLIAVFDFVVRRYPIQADGSLGVASEVAGPFGPTLVHVVGSERLLVATSYPAEVWCYDLGPVLALRGPATGLGAEMSVVKLVSYLDESWAFAITKTYDMATHELHGQIRNLHLSSDTEIADGAPAVVQTQFLEQGNNLSDACFASVSPGWYVRVTDESNGLLYDVQVNFLSGVPQLGTVETRELGGHPTGILPVYEYADDGVLILDGQAAEVARFRQTSSSSPLQLLARTRTRTYPLAMVELKGPRVTLSTETLFVASAQDSTLRALRTNPSTPGLLELSAQGPVATGPGPLAVVASQAGPYVYTANDTGSSINAFHLDETTLALGPIEVESLDAGAQPSALALTPGGSHLYALDAAGSVIALRVDPLDGSVDLTGSLAIDGSMSGACLRMDPLARFVFVVQPALGRITSLRLTLPFGTPTWASALNALADPVDLLPSVDGRFVSVLERGAARVSTYAIEGLTGELVATGSTMPTGVAPVSLATRRPVGICETRETLRVFDPQQQFVVPIERVQLTSELHTGFDFATELAPGTHTLIALSDGSYPHSGSFGTGLIGLNPAGLDQRLTLYRYEPPPGANSYVETDSVLLGVGQHALATRTRAISP